MAGVLTSPLIGGKPGPDNRRLVAMLPVWRSPATTTNVLLLLLTCKWRVRPCERCMTYAPLADVYCLPRSGHLPEMGTAQAWSTSFHVAYGRGCMIS
jgi:hypothetical protein